MTSSLCVFIFCHFDVYMLSFHFSLFMSTSCGCSDTPDPTVSITSTNRCQFIGCKKELSNQLSKSKTNTIKCCLGTQTALPCCAGEGGWGGMECPVNEDTLGSQALCRLTTLASLIGFQYRVPAVVLSMHKMCVSGLMLRCSHFCVGTIYPWCGVMCTEV